jgi:hypothetical protein
MPDLRFDGLHLYEQMLLLMLDDEKGTFDKRAQVSLTLVAAADADLFLSGRLGLVPTGSTSVVRVEDPTPTHDPVLDACMEVIAAGRRPAPLHAWIPRQSRIRRLRGMAAESLASRGIVRVDEHAVLGIFPTRRYPEVGGSPEADLIAALETAVFTDTDDIDRRVRLLVSLADANGILRRRYGRARMRERSRRIEQLTSETAIGAALKRAIDEVNATLASVATTSAVAAGS